MPADFADEAQAIQDTFFRDSLVKHRMNSKSPAFSGFCLFCEEPVHERRFCDSLCRQEFESKKSK